MKQLLKRLFCSHKSKELITVGYGIYIEKCRHCGKQKEVRR